MRIAIDGRTLTGRFTGDRTYWLNLIRSLVVLPETHDAEFLIYSRLPIPAGVLPDSSKLKQIVLSSVNDRIWMLATLPLALRKEKVDLLHVQYTTPLPFLCPCPVVTTVHDITFKLFPEWYALKDRFLLNLTVPLAMKQAKYVITVSHSSRKDILRTYVIAPDKVVATPLGLPEAFVALSQSAAEGVTKEVEAEIYKKYGIARPFVLSVGVLQPRKNNRFLIEAFAKAKEKYSLPHSLQMVGKLGWNTDISELKALARKSGGVQGAEGVQFPGYVEDSDLPTLYRMCDLFAHSALYEGFGIPPLEAMACGAPTLVSDAPALPEVVGDAARIVSVHDLEGWVIAIGELLQSPEERSILSQKGRERVKLFSWSETARLTWEVYGKCV